MKETPLAKTLCALASHDVDFKSVPYSQRFPTGVPDRTIGKTMTDVSWKMDSSAYSLVFDPEGILRSATVIPSTGPERYKLVKEQIWYGPIGRKIRPARIAADGWTKGWAETIEGIANFEDFERARESQPMQLFLQLEKLLGFDPFVRE